MPLLILMTYKIVRRFVSQRSYVQVMYIFAKNNPRIQAPTIMLKFKKSLTFNDFSVTKIL